MKKIVFAIVFTLAVLLSVSCGRNQDFSKDLSEDRSSVVEYTYDTKPKDGPVQWSSNGEITRVQEFKYKGHQYIQFDVISSRGGRSGIVHDPDCPCLNK